MTCSVQKKLPCVFETTVLRDTKGKHRGQNFKVVASGSVKGDALIKIKDALATEKIDGTCVLIRTFNGRPWLWARHDRKPTKVADKRFSQYRSKLDTVLPDGKGEHKIVEFVWNVEEDFKDVPDDWIPADGVELQDGIAQPDDNGHILGWVPVDVSTRIHCWHATAVDLIKGLALILRKQDERLEIAAVPMSELEEQTLELIGTHVNGNPYGIGSKHCPVHVLVVHGSIPITSPTFPGPHRDGLEEWFVHTDGAVEGVVWHCNDGALYKLHRHHINLPWPVSNPQLSSLPVSINVDIPVLEASIKCYFNESSLFYKLGALHGMEVTSLKDLHAALSDALSCAEK